MTVNYSIIVSCSAHFPPGGRNSGSMTDRVIADSRYSESRYSEARLYVEKCQEVLIFVADVNRMTGGRNLKIMFIVTYLSYPSSV